MWFDNALKRDLMWFDNALKSWVRSDDDNALESDELDALKRWWVSSDVIW